MRRYLKTILIFFLALAPRIYQLGFDVINIDASFWKENTYNFIGLFFQGKFGDMAITHHPGVTLMWLGGAAMKVFRGAYYLLHGATAPDTHAVYLWTHFAQKLPIALLTSVFVVFVYWSVEKLLDGRVALLSAILLTLEPFFLAHSRVFHLDALLTVFMCSSVLALLLYLQDRNKKWLVASGILGGLALLTKSTALFLLPYTVLVSAAFPARLRLRANSLAGGPNPSGLKFVTRRVFPAAAWLGIVGLVFVVLYPAMWLQPLNTLKLYFSGLTTEATATDPTFYATSRHYIFGQQTYNPRWYYYPFVLTLRLSPAVLVFGLVGVFWGFWEFVREKRLSSRSLFIVYCLLFITILSLPAKKLDRYILPTVPFFCILAAYGLTKTFEWFKIKKFLVFAVTVFTVFTGFTVFTLHPDYGFYFSPLFGGIKTGLRFDSDYWWGEGYKKAADYLNSKPDAENLKVALYDFRSFEPFFDGKTLDAGSEEANQANYFIYLIKDRPGLGLERKIKIGGIDYWGVYENL